MTRPNQGLSLSLSLSLTAEGQVGENPGNEVGLRIYSQSMSSILVASGLINS